MSPVRRVLSDGGKEKIGLRLPYWPQARLFLKTNTTLRVGQTERREGAEMEMTKKKLILAVCCIGLLSVLAIYPKERWTVKPAVNGLWRSCLEERAWYEPWSGMSCGSPMPYDMALWWSETKGGRLTDR